jgi:adenylate cyclase
VAAALEMRKRLDLLNERPAQNHLPMLRHGIGIHTVQVLAANVGSPERLSYTLVGDTVNIASRIQDLNKDFSTDILISATTRSALTHSVGLKKMPETPIRGKTEPVEIYRVL